MAVNKSAYRTAQRHTQYALKDGTWVPGCTTVTKLLNPGEGLVKAANNLGLQGIDSSEEWGITRKIGSLAHKLIEHQLKGTDPSADVNSSGCDPNGIASARKSLAKFNAWLAQRDVRFIDSEFQLVSEKYRYGSTGDFLGYVNGALSYCDFKTGGLFLEGEIQGAANAENLNENGRGPIAQIILLGLPRNDEDQFHEKVLTEWGDHFVMFRHLLGAYTARQTIESVKKGAAREAASNVIPFVEVEQNAILRAAIAAKTK